MTDPSGCGAPAQDAALPAGVDPARDTLISGVVRAGAAPVAGAYVRLLDAGGDFTAEVVTSDTGRFRFFAAPGTWTVRALSRHGTANAVVRAGRGGTEVTLGIEPAGT